MILKLSFHVIQSLGLVDPNSFSRFEGTAVVEPTATKAAAAAFVAISRSSADVNAILNR